MNEEDEKNPVYEEEEEEDEDEQAVVTPVPDPVKYPDGVNKPLDGWMISTKKGDPLRKEIIPLETEDEFLQIEYAMYPLGATQKIWGNSQNLIANVESEVERKHKKGEKISKGVVAQLVHSFYLIGCLEKMVKMINGKKVTPVWFQVECSVALGNILQVWINGVLKHKPYPKPAWILYREGKIEEAAKAEKRGLLVEDPEGPRGSSNDSVGEDGGPPSGSSLAGGGPPQ